MRQLFDLPDVPQPVDGERMRAELDLRISAPLRSPAAQHDVSSTPLFIAVNEPSLLGQGR